MRKAVALFALAALAGCAHLSRTDSAEEQRQDSWNAAHAAYALGDYQKATGLFEELAATPNDGYGYESLFYLGALRLDPRNPAWDPQPAAVALDQYLEAEFVPYTRHHTQWPEARVLRELARQLNMPPEERVAALQPTTETRVVRVVVPAEQSRALRDEVDRLRQELADREQELERIRRTLTPKGR